LGIDTLLFRFLPLHIVEDPTYSHIDPNIPNQIIPVSADITQTDTLSAVILEECNRLSYCDTVKIHGDTLVCGDTKIMTFTAFKNKECGAIVQWRLDNSIVDSMQTLSDSSVRIWFKNVTWNGKLYALIPTGTCSSIVIDSIELHVVKLQGKINLGEDTVLCPQNVYLLRAGHGYKSYLWIDGSTDSILLIKDPGTYFVEVTDYCGAKDADTIVVTAAPPIPFYIGPDLDVCAYSTTTISAPSGFLNYTWSPDYNIDKLTSPSVNISPLLDTTYYIKAEKTPGCFAYDTLHVRVHSSPSIKLGNDTSFCTGGSLPLNAGPGFTQTIWNTGETNQTIEVNQAGVYSVIGITANDCKSFDTLNVVNVWPIPLVDLGKDSTLCADTSRILTPGNFLSYLWQDGSTNSTYTVKNLGTYDVQVADIHGCRAKDSIIINTLLPYPSNFLLPFDSICSYDNLQLIPLKEYNRYLWSTGQETSSVFVGMPGMYTLKVTDDKGCSGSDSIMIYVKDCLKGFYIPSAFTPNNDKLNDTFKPSIGGILTEYEFTIYSRWGQIIFTTKSINEAWNGTLNGIPQSSGLFIWTCVWQVEGNQSRLERGAVMLIR
jgi:gliding motility-associated-like protein